MAFSILSYVAIPQSLLERFYHPQKKSVPLSSLSRLLALRNHWSTFYLQVVGWDMEPFSTWSSSQLWYPRGLGMVSVPAPSEPYAELVYRANEHISWLVPGIT